MSDELVAGYSACVKLIVFVLFFVVNSMKSCLRCGEKKNPEKVQNRHAKRIEASARFSCLFITQQTYEKGTIGNKAILHTSMNGGCFTSREVKSSFSGFIHER